MSRRKDAALTAAGILLGLAISGPAAQAGLTANPSTQTFYVQEEKVNLEAYSINGSNYVRLRDIGQAVGFGVTYDAAANSVIIRPEQPYTEEVNVPSLTNGRPVTEENVLELLRQIEQDWPAGTNWGTDETPGTRKNEVPSGETGRLMRRHGVDNTYGCGAYASMVSSLLFGDEENPVRQLEDLTQMRPGDIVFWVLNESGRVGHVTVALESPNEFHAFHYTDGNCGGKVCWPEDLNSRDNLDCYRGEHATMHLEVWTRYPESVPYTGNSVDGWLTGD